MEKQWKISKTKTVHKTDKTLHRMTKSKKEEDENIRNWNVDIIIQPLHIQRMTKEYYKQLYAHKFNN